MIWLLLCAFMSFSSIFFYVLITRSVFVVGLNEQLLGAAVRLEAALHELAQNYYHTHIKNVRAQKVNILLERPFERISHSKPLRCIWRHPYPPVRLVKPPPAIQGEERAKER